MCRQPQLEIKDLSMLPKLVAEKTLTDMQLAISKAGGSIKNSELKQMSLQHFVCLCSMNQIRIDFK